MAAMRTLFVTDPPPDGAELAATLDWEDPVR